MKGVKSMLSTEYQIQKSMPLLSQLQKSKLSVSELKLIEVYLSKINSHDTQSREVTFSKAELDKLFGTSLRVADLKKSLDTIRRFEVKNIFEDDFLTTETTVNLFEMSEITYSDSGVQQIKLSCSEVAMRYFFDIENLRYLKYKLKNTIYLTSKYSFRLFMYLLENKFKDSWIVKLSDLIEELQVPYDNYTDLNKHILKSCCKEIKEKTSLDFMYTNVRRGQNHDTKEIVFNILSWGDLPQVIEQAQEQEEPKQIVTQAEEKPYMDTQQPATQEEEQEDSEPDYLREKIEFLAESVDNSFTTLQMKLIIATLSEINIPDSQYGREVAQYNYLHKKYLQLQIAEQQAVIKNRFNYFMKMIQNEVMQP